MEAWDIKNSMDKEIKSMSHESYAGRSLDDGTPVHVIDIIGMLQLTNAIVSLETTIEKGHKEQLKQLEEIADSMLLSAQAITAVNETLENGQRKDDRRA